RAADRKRYRTIGKRAGEDLRRVQRADEGDRDVAVAFELGRDGDFLDRLSGRGLEPFRVVDAVAFHRDQTGADVGRPNLDAGLFARGVLRLAELQLELGFVFEAAGHVGITGHLE